MKLLDINQVMKRLDVKSRRTIDKWLDEGILPQPIKHWGWRKWSEEQLNSVLAHEKPTEE